MAGRRKKYGSIKISGSLYAFKTQHIQRKQVYHIHSDGDDNKSNSFDCAADVAYGLSGIEIELVKECLDKCHFNCVLAGNLEAIVIIDCFRDIAESFYTEASDSDAAQNMLMYLKGYCEA